MSAARARPCPTDPHAVFEDCTIVGPDNALQAGYPGVDELCTRVKFKNCRLIVLNFSQPLRHPFHRYHLLRVQGRPAASRRLRRLPLDGLQGLRHPCWPGFVHHQGQSPSLRAIPTADARGIRAIGAVADRRVQLHRTATTRPRRKSLTAGLRRKTRIASNPRTLTPSL